MSETPLCPKCKGWGVLFHELTGPFSPDKEYVTTCPECNGKDVRAFLAAREKAING